MKVQVVHIKDYGKTSKVLSDGSQYIYCGRPSRLGNPYYMKHESQRQTVINQCDADPEFHKVIKEFKAWLTDKEITDIKLGCFCAPKACHCDIIKRELLK